MSVLRFPRAPRRVICVAHKPERGGWQVWIDSHRQRRRWLAGFFGRYDRLFRTDAEATQYAEGVAAETGLPVIYQQGGSSLPGSAA